MTGTRTRTTTTARSELLKANVEVVTMRLLDNAVRLLERAIRPALEKHYIRRIEFRALDDDGLCHAQLRLVIDWDEHKDRLEFSGKVRVNGRWVDKVAPEVQVLLRYFEEAVASKTLAVRAVAYAAPGIDPERLRQELGLKRGRSVQWADPPSQMGYHVKQLEELFVGLELAEESA